MFFLYVYICILKIECITFRIRKKFENYVMFLSYTFLSILSFFFSSCVSRAELFLLSFHSRLPYLFWGLIPLWFLQGHVSSLTLFFSWIFAFSLLLDECSFPCKGVLPDPKLRVTWTMKHFFCEGSFFLPSITKLFGRAVWSEKLERAHAPSIENRVANPGNGQI